MSLPPPRGRERLDAAGESLARMRQELGLAPPDPTNAAAGRLAAGAALESALQAARERLKELTEELDIARARAESGEEENRRLSEELESRPGEEALETAREQARDEERRQRAELETRVRILVERLTLQQAELVRLESLRRKAEAAVSDGEKSRRAVEEALRRELRQAHAALDSASAAAGAREGQVRADLEGMHARLDAATKRVQEVEKERRRLAARADEEARLLRTQPGLKDLAVELVSERQRADDAVTAAVGLREELEAMRRERADLGQRAQSLEERLTLLQAELARAEAARREAAAQAAASEGRLRAEIEAQTREKREQDVSGGESARLRDEAVRERAALAARVKELEERSVRLESEARRAEIQRSGAEAALADALNARRAIEESLRQELRAAHTALEQADGGLGTENRRLRASLAGAEARLETASARVRELEKESAAQLTAAAAESAQPAPDAPESDFILPPIEPTLEAGWARLLRLVRPPVEAAYGHLRRLSAVPLAAGPRALVRLTAVSLSQAEEALTAIELVLSDAPASLPSSSVVATLDQSLGAWEPALRRQGVTLVRDVPRLLPDAAHEPRALRAILYQIMRNALEALPKGSRLTVTAARAPDGALRLDISDDGPGYPADWLAKRFEPFAASRRGHAGLGLAAVARTLKRWGGAAEAENGPNGRGTRLCLLFAPPLPEGPEPVTLQP
ncbi:MAG: hypothetical protein HY923_01505 [Elusimicrobia bacterium]|nr:hypothetical protein [Elusimicrobiota bacterium]